MIRCGIVLACALAIAPVAQAQQPIAADVAAVWTHDQSGLSAPPALAGFDRTGVEQYDRAQRDVAISYSDRASHTTTTLYVFFAGLPDVSLWHDRIRVAMGAGVLGTPDFANAKDTVFNAPGESAPGGLRTSVAMTGKSTKASGVAIFAHNGWLIATRMSSDTLDRDALDARLAAFIAALPVPAGKAAPAPVYIVAPCTGAFDPPPAKPIDGGPLPTTAIELGMQATVMDKPDKAPTGHWCRGTPSQLGFGVYRREGEPGYVIAIGDGGSAISVVPDLVASELHEGVSAYAVFLATTVDRTGYGVFDGVPSFGQAIALINAHRPLVGVNRATRPGEKTNITIYSSDPAKKAP